MSKKSKRQVRKSPTSSVTSSVTARAEGEMPNYSYVMQDLKRIGILAGSFFVILIILSFILR